MKLVEYLDSRDRSPFETWFQRINAQAAAKVTTALVRLEGGNTSNVKRLGSGVHELKNRLRTGVPGLFWLRRPNDRDPIGWWNKKAPG